MYCCETLKKNFVHGDEYGLVYLFEGRFYIDTSGGEYSGQAIDYCPWCGKLLSPDNIS